MKQLFALLVLVLTACDADSVEMLQQPIVNGQPYSSGRPWVGKINDSGGGFCTGTLIGKKTVLTAGHCVESGMTYTFDVGGGTYQVSSALRHPQYNSNVIDGGGSNANDIALMFLSQAPNVATATISGSVPTVGLPITIVGYGVSSETGQDDGRRIGQAAVGWVGATELGWNGSSTISTTCYGDSGGPAFATIGGKEVQISICSRGTDVCGVDDVQTRVDSFSSWIVTSAKGDVILGGSSTPTTDTQAPKVTITSPTDGASVSGTITVEATISDDVGAVKAELAVDGAVSASLTAAPWKFQISIGSGSHVLVVGARDAAGNRGTARVTVNNSGSTGSATDAGTSQQQGGAGGFGDSCLVNDDCLSQLCAESGGVKYCTETCSTTCSSGATCVSAGTMKVCTPPSTGSTSGLASGGGTKGGCSAAPSAPGSLLFPLLLLVGLAALRARRAASSRSRAPAAG
jgi:uncharacterized protein (TIGR03382 family)